MVTVSNTLCPPSWPTAPTESKDSTNAAVVQAPRSPQPAGYMVIAGESLDPILMLGGPLAQDLFVDDQNAAYAKAESKQRR